MRSPKGPQRSPNQSLRGSHIFFKKQKKNVYIFLTNGPSNVLKLLSKIKCKFIYQESLCVLLCSLSLFVSIKHCKVIKRPPTISRKFRLVLSNNPISLNTEKIKEKSQCVNLIFDPDVLKCNSTEPVQERKITVPLFGSLALLRFNIM